MTSEEKATRTVYLTFPKKVLSVPIFWSIPQKFKVVYNIRGASITDAMGIMALDLEGDAQEVDRLVEYFRELGVKVESTAPEGPSAAAGESDKS